MSAHTSISSLLSRDDSRSASTGLLVIGVLLGGSAVSAAFWLRSERVLRWFGRACHRPAVHSDSRPGQNLICVLEGLSKPGRSDAIEVATCFGITDIWVVASADAADLQPNFSQTHNGSMFSANGLTVTMRIFASAQECCAALTSGGWTICLASCEPSQAGLCLLGNKVAIVTAEPSPSKAFLQAAIQAPAGQGKLPAAAALALTLHHCTTDTDAQAPHQERLSRPDAREDASQQLSVSSDLPTDFAGHSEQSAIDSPRRLDAGAAYADAATSSHDASSSSPSKAGTSEPEASGSLDTSSATVSDSNSPEAGKPQAHDSTFAESQVAVESAFPDVQQADSASGSCTPQLTHAAGRILSPVGHAPSPEARSNALSAAAGKPGRLAGTSATIGSSNGEQGDDASSVRSQDTTASRASKMQASEMSRMQAQAMRRSGVMRRHGMGGPGGSRPASSMGSPTGSVASVSTSGWPETSPYKY